MPTSNTQKIGTILTVVASLFGAVIAINTPSDTVRADIIVATEAMGEFEEGDVIHAFTEAHNMNVRASHIVHPKRMARENGRIVQGAILENYLELTKQYKFVRVSETEVRRIVLATGDYETIDNTPNANGEYMDVPLYIERRLKHPTNLIFGTAGAEYWYGGDTYVTDERMNAVWDNIEARTAHVRNKTFPFTAREKEKFLILTVEKTPEEIRDLVLPEIAVDAQGNATTTRARKNKIDLTPFQSERARQNKDIRGTVRAVTIQAKP